MFAFKFIGVITIGNILICCLPKYYNPISSLDGSDTMPEFSEIIKVLKEFGKTDYLPDSSISSTDININCSEIVLADKILKDYVQYGIFNKWQDIISLNSEGETNWDYTITLTDPIFSKKSPVYHNVYSSETISESQNLIREIHKWALNYSYNKYSTILDYSFWYEKDCVECLKELGTLDYLKTTLQKELNISFIDRNILLLKTLLRLIENVYYSSDETFSIYGTGSFHVIWEKICSWMFQNKIDDYINFIPKPTWYDLSGNKKEQNTLRPDIVTDNENDIYVFDAKYYNFSHRNDFFDVINNPGISDVSKQFLYADTFTKQLKKNVLNIFLFPKIQDNLYTLIGYVKLPILFESIIYNIQVSPQRLFSSFLKKDRPDSLLCDIKTNIGRLH